MNRLLPPTLNVSARFRGGKELLKFYNSLVDHFGGEPTNVERILIERCCQIQLRLMVVDLEFKETDRITETDSSRYLAWSNTLARSIKSLGKPRAARSQAPTLDDILAERRKR